jgi:hypothetical protein
MYFLFSGEGPSDLGMALSSALICEGKDYRSGPMAVLVDRIVEDRRQYSLLDSQSCGFVAEHNLGETAGELKAAKKSIRLPGVKQPKETRYFFNNARILARIAKRKGAELACEVVAILFRDSDGTASAGRGLWYDKFTSVMHGFKEESFDTGVPMVPKPKSEAWLLCGLTGCSTHDGQSLEDWSGNDKSPRSLKAELSNILTEDTSAEALCQMVRDQRIDFYRIALPSFNAFKTRLLEVV